MEARANEGGCRESRKADNAGTQPGEDGENKADEAAYRDGERRENDRQKSRDNRRADQKDGHGDKNVHKRKIVEGFHVVSIGIKTRQGKRKD